VPKIKKSRKGAKGGVAGASSAEESEGEKTHDEDDAAPRPRPRPKPKRATRANPVVEEAAALDESNSNKLDDPVTPKTRPRPRPIHRDKTPTGSLHGIENGQNSLPGSPLPPATPSEEEDPQELGEPINEITTPKSSLKRPRTDEDEAMEAPNGTTDPDPLANVDGTPDMQVRRKRIRH
jgi:cohesin complex subunit SA-1/2